MNFESFERGIEKFADKVMNQATNFEKTFQNNTEGTKPRHIDTKNEGMAGQWVNGVKFARRVFSLDGEKVEGVFPVFKAEFTCNLPENLYTASDSQQMRYCTKKLAARIEHDPEFASKFSAKQLEQIKNGEPRISGLTWHHNEIPGKMQLVNAAEHNAARHTGGRSIWGGGKENR